MRLFGPPPLLLQDSASFHLGTFTSSNSGLTVTDTNMPLLQSKNAVSGDAPKQYNQRSRKGKKAWRKNVDVEEVQEGLKDLNEQIIRGYASNSCEYSLIVWLILSAVVLSRRRLPKISSPSTQPQARNSSKSSTSKSRRVSRPTRSSTRDHPCPLSPCASGLVTRLPTDSFPPSASERIGCLTRSSLV